MNPFSPEKMDTNEGIKSPSNKQGAYAVRSTSNDWTSSGNGTLNSPMNEAKVNENVGS